MHQGIEVILLLSDDNENPTPGDTGEPDAIADAGTYYVLSSDQITDNGTYLTYSTNIPVVNNENYITVTLENPTPGDTGFPDLIADADTYYVLTSDQVTDNGAYLTYSTDIPVVNNSNYITVTLEARHG